jgi:hypothetical protein
MSNLGPTILFYNNLHQLRLLLSDWKATQLKGFWAQVHRMLELT